MHLAMLPVSLRVLAQRDMFWIWPPGRAAIRVGLVRVVIGNPRPTSGLTRHDVARLRDQAQEAICSAHRDLVLAMSAEAVPSAANPSGRTGQDRG